jgi:RNA-splicing ligase RtcB
MSSPMEASQSDVTVSRLDWANERVSAKLRQDELARQGILVRSPSTRGIAEEAPGAYKDLEAVVLAAEMAGIAQRVASLRPLICIKG